MALPSKDIVPYLLLRSAQTTIHTMQAKQSRQFSRELARISTSVTDSVGTAKLESFLYFINKKLGTVFNGIISQHKLFSCFIS
jgi:hypothetical protein